MCALRQYSALSCSQSFSPRNSHVFLCHKSSNPSTEVRTLDSRCTAHFRPVPLGEPRPSRRVALSGLEPLAIVRCNDGQAPPLGPCPERRPNVGKQQQHPPPGLTLLTTPSRMRNFRLGPQKCHKAALQSSGCLFLLPLSLQHGSDQCGF